jgi:hypothetical protein
MRRLAGFIVVALILAGCQNAGGSIQHEDSDAGANHDAGPTLCKDGTPPPCTIRD